MRRALRTAVFFLMCSFFGSLSAQNAVTPVPKDNDGWRQKYQKEYDRIAAGNVDLIFAGDSIVESLDYAGREVFDYYYEGRNAVTLGIGGDETQHLLWRLENLPLAGLSPKGIVVMIGSNNLYHPESNEQIAKGILACCEKLRALFPDAPILCLGITPEGEFPCCGVNPRIPGTNRIAEELTRSVPNLTYRRTGPLWCDEQGNATKEMTRDFCHPTAKGCAVWLADLEPIIAEWFGEEPKEPFSAE